MEDNAKPLLEKDEEEEEVQAIVSTGASYFKLNRNLAISMGFWITVFCIPVCSKWTQVKLFGEMKDTVYLPGWLTSTEKDKTDLCAQWPAVFTLMFFMVLKDTGTTVSNCWSALVGITVSTVNILILYQFFPHGGECITLSNHTIATGLRFYCEEYRDPNYGSAWGWMVWLDFFLFVLIELASNATEPSMKFGLCWHCGYMMNIMKPEGVKFSIYQVITALVGLWLAILVTLVPNVCSICRGHEPKFCHVATLKLGLFPTELADKVSDVWKNSIDFLHKSPGLDRHTRTSMRFAIDSKIDAIEPIIKRMGEFYAASWWEKFLFLLCCRPDDWEIDRKHVKRFIDGFGDNIGGVDDVLYMAKKVILSDEYDNYAGLHTQEKEDTQKERGVVQKQMNDLADAVADHLKKIAARPEKRDYDYNEERAIEEISKKEKELRKAYMDVEDLAENSSRPRSRLRNQFGCLVFGLLCYSTQVKTTFKNQLETVNEFEKWFDRMKEIMQDPRQITKTSVWKYVLNTFGETNDDDGTYKMFWHKWYNDIDKKMFVGRNFVSISMCFVLGNFFKGNVYDGFNANMAVTLCVLISHFPGTAFETNLNRLLGLTLGKVLPIIMMAVVTLTGERGIESTLFHLGMIWMYEAFFAFIYYTSKDWGNMAVLVAGFGCGALIGTRSTNWSDDIFNTQYKEIGQVTGAIMIQMTVDVVDTTLRKRWPRDMFVKKMRELGMRADEVAVAQWNREDSHGNLLTLTAERPTDETKKDMDGSLVNAFEAFMGAKSKDGVQPMMKCIQETKELVEKQESLLGECNPRSIIVRGSRTPFKYETTKDVMIWVRRLVHEMELLYMVYDKGPTATGTEEMCPHFIHSLELEKNFQKGVLTALRITFMDLQTLLEFDKDGFIKREYTGNPKMPDQEMQWRISEQDDSPTTRLDFERDLCVCVAQRALFDALNHVAEIQHICYSSGKFDYQEFQLSNDP